MVCVAFFVTVSVPVDLGASFICGTSTEPPVNPLYDFSLSMGFTTRPKHRDGELGNAWYDKEFQPLDRPAVAEAEAAYHQLLADMLVTGEKSSHELSISDVVARSVCLLTSWYDPFVQFPWSCCRAQHHSTNGSACGQHAASGKGGIWEKDWHTYSLCAIDRGASNLIGRGGHPISAPCRRGGSFYRNRGGGGGDMCALGLGG